MAETQPLLSPRRRVSPFRGLLKTGAVLAVLSALTLLIKSWARGAGEGGVIALLAGRGGGQVLYQDWRGVSLEQKDAFFFSHTWSGTIDVGHTEQHIVRTPNLTYPALVVEAAAVAGVQKIGGSEGSTSAGGILANLKQQALEKYDVELGGDWSGEEVEGLLMAYGAVCGYNSPVATKICGLKHSKWDVSDAKIVDDVFVQGSKVTVSRLALEHSKAKAAEFDGVKGRVRSRRLQHAVMRVVTGWGHKPEVVDNILQRLFGTTLNVDIGYTKLTQDTTIEDGARFMNFKPRELMLALEAWSDMPEHMHHVPGLRYLTRRQQGLNHPLYGGTTAVSWPTNLDQSYQEYMDFSFNSDAYTSRHLFIHEKTHFFWGRKWTQKVSFLYPLYLFVLVS